MIRRWPIANAALAVRHADAARAMVVATAHATVVATAPVNDPPQRMFNRHDQLRPTHRRRTGRNKMFSRQRGQRSK